MPVQATESSRGSIILFYGPVCGGKGLQLVVEASKASYARKPNVKPIFLKPGVDTFGKTRIKSRIGFSRVAEVLPNDVRAACARLRKLFKKHRIIAIDEVQFLCLPKEGEPVDQELVQLVVDTLIEGMLQGVQIFLAGLDADFLRQPFPLSKALLLDARIMHRQMPALCKTCGNVATLSQRLHKGKPASRHEPVLVVKSERKAKAVDTYEPRCVFHHVIPD